MISRTLSRVASKSSLWRPWTSNPTADYDQNLHKYPWLSRDDEDGVDDEDNLRYDFPLDSDRSPRRYTTPLPSLPETAQHNLNWPFGVSGQPYGRIDDGDPARESLDVSPEGSVAAAESHSLRTTPAADHDPAAIEDPHLVTWTGSMDPGNPHNWPKYKKWSSTILVSCFTFISPVSSTMLAPALPDLADRFNTSGLESYLIMSIFLLAYAIGPFILAPLSEMYGRVVVLQAANMVFLIFNTICGFAQTKTQIMVFRFLSGLGGAAPQALGGGVLSDCWKAEERGSAVAVYSLAPFLGPAIGPIAGGYLTQYMDWRWIFWVVSMADALVQVLAFLFLPETYAPAILSTRAKFLRDLTGNKELHTEYEQRDRTFAQVLSKNLARPFIMLATQPTIQITGLYRAYLYGLMYLVLASFPMVWEEQYGQEPGRASLNYASLGVGFVIGLQVSGQMIDKVYKSLKVRYNSPGRPEFRVPLMLPTAIIAPGGLLLYGVSAHFQTHWIVPNIGAAIFAGGLILSFQCAQTYVIDSYERYAASATGAAAFIRTMAGFSFPLFAPKLYERMGIAWGNGILSGTALVICLLAPAILWRFGERIRARSQYCAG